MRRDTAFAAAALAVVALDQATKHLVLSRMLLHERIAVIPGLLNLTYIRNSGIAFGMMSGWGGAPKVVFLVAATLAALALLVWFLREVPPEGAGRGAVIGMVAGGAVGNLVDRLRFGEVVDFIDVYWRSHHWPFFNVADSAITVGVVLLVALQIRVDGRRVAEGV